MFERALNHRLNLTENHLTDIACGNRLVAALGHVDEHCDEHIQKIQQVRINHDIAEWIEPSIGIDVHERNQNVKPVGVFLDCEWACGVVIEHGVVFFFLVTFKHRGRCGLVRDRFVKLFFRDFPRQVARLRVDTVVIEFGLTEVNLIEGCEFFRVRGCALIGRVIVLIGGETINVKGREFLVTLARLVKR